MAKPFGKLVAEELIQLGIATQNKIVGCSLEEIDEIKRRQDVTLLPQFYEDYLLILGKQAGNLDIGSDCFYPRLLVLKEWANELLEENNAHFKLPPDAFVIMMHQGYQFLYFLTQRQIDDPPVLYYTEDPEYVEDLPHKLFEHLSEYLTGFISVAKNKQAQDAFIKNWKTG
jgi:hypothetical protein